MKKLLSIFLAGLMLFGFGAGAGAAEEDGEPDSWDDFYIITQPPAQLTVPFGKSFTLSVEAHVPEGAKVSYVWQAGYGSSVAVEGAVSQVSPGDPLYPTAYRPYETAYKYYNCVITAVEEDAQGNVARFRTLDSDGVQVTLLAERERNLWESLRDWWGQLFMGLFLWAYFGVIWFLGLLMTPVYIIQDMFR
ncbi:MAG: hypothetical protein LBB75_00935 [Oscillospiraceae bacterium]|jgi:hypothetical protein|nr:hypothetical protein [Oscillospiraceae bacterium]